MATVVAKPPGVQDDEEWLYGGAGGENEPSVPGTGFPSDKEEGEMSTSEPASQSQEKNDDDDDDDSDDDDVHVTIGDIKAFPVTGTGPGLFKPPATYQKQPVVASGQQKGGGGGTAAAKGVDVDGEGQVNGINMYEFSLDTLKDDEKPWRKPGADITDYFNYGFNEETWRKYCQKQCRLRMDNGLSAPKAFNPGMTGTTIVKTEFDNPVKHYRPPIPPQPPSGAIAVLGSTTASRRPVEEQIENVQQIGSLATSVNKPPPGMPGMPDFTMPPPGMPPMPPGFSTAVPPPGMNLPPPVMFNHPPPGPVPPPFFPQVQPVAENRNYNSGDRSFNSYESGSQPGYNEKSWDSRDRDRDWDKDRDDSYSRERDRDSDDDYRYSSSRNRDYGSNRDYDRDYYRSRDSERSRDRDRERSRSRSRDRDRRHRDRDDKRNKRKVKDEPDDSDYYKSSSSSSKHKKSKRSKRDKDDDVSDSKADD